MLEIEGYQAVSEVNIEDDFEDYSSNDNKNIILYGPPGTGKTYNTIVEQSDWAGYYDGIIDY